MEEAYVPRQNAGCTWSKKGNVIELQANIGHAQSFILAQKDYV